MKCFPKFLGHLTFIANSAIYCIRLLQRQDAARQKQIENVVFICFCARLSLPFDKIGCGSAKTN